MVLRLCSLKLQFKFTIEQKIVMRVANAAKKIVMLRHASIQNSLQLCGQRSHVICYVSYTATRLIMQLYPLHNTCLCGWCQCSHIMFVYVAGANAAT